MSGKGTTIYGRAALAALAAACLLGGPAPAADWPLFRGNSARTGFADETAAPPLARDWDFTAGDEIMSSPAVAGGAVYFGARDGKLRALSAATGALLWEYATGGWVDSSPAVDGGAVYATSLDGYLYALDSVGGQLLWRAPLGGPSVSSPLVYGGKVFAGAGMPASALKVFDAVTGSLLYSVPAGQPVESAPSTDGTLVYFGANDGGLYAVQPAGGAQAWLYQTMGGRYGSGAAPVSGGRVYAVPGFDESKPLALDAAGTLLNPLSGSFASLAGWGDGWVQAAAPAVAGGRLYFSAGSGSSAVSLFAAEAVPAAQALAYAWTSTTTLGAFSPRGMLSSPAVAAGVIYAGSIDGYLTVFSTAGAVLPPAADVTFPGPVYASPAVANGRVFAAGGTKISAFSAAYASAISAPAAGAVVNGTVTVKGYAAQPSVSGFELEYGAGAAPSSWVLISSAAAGALADAALAQWDTAPLANGLYTLRLTVLPGPANSARLTLRVNAAPFPPASLSASDEPGDGGNRINLAWAAAPGSPAYRVYRSGALLASVSSSTLSYADLFAVTGATYVYTVRSYDGYVESQDSAQASAFSVNDTGDFTPPGPVTDLAAGPGTGAGSLRLDWTAVGNDGDAGMVSHYEIRCSTDTGYDWANAAFDGADLYASTAPAEGPAGDSQGTEIEGLLGGVAYSCVVRAADSVPQLGALLTVYAATATATPDLVPPQPPAELLVIDTPGDDGRGLSLSWTLSPDDGAGAGDVRGYKIFRRSQTGAFFSTAPYALVGAGVSVYKDTAALEGVRLYYVAAAYDSTNNSPFSAEASAVAASNWRFLDSAQGGLVRLPDGAHLEIPPGGIAQNGWIMLMKVDAVSLQPLVSASAHPGANPTPVVYEVRLSSYSLTGTAVLTLPYADSDVAGMNAENLRMYTMPSSGGTWKLLNKSTVDPQARKVSAEVDHFSYFSIMEYVPSGAVLAENEVYTYPNPARGDTVTFKFRPVYKADVKIDVYNVAGEKVARFELPACPAGTVSEVVWRTANIASGVYVYRLEAKTAAGSRTVEKKLAIIH